MAKIKIDSKQAFLAYAKKILKEELEKIKGRQYSFTDPSEEERKKAEKKEKDNDVRNELETTDAQWTPVGFQRRKPTAPTSKFKSDRDKFMDRTGNETKPSLTQEPTKSKTLGTTTHFTTRDDDGDEEEKVKRVEKTAKDYVGKDRTYFDRKKEPLNVNVDDAEGYVEERGIRNLIDFRSYLGRRLVKNGFDKKKLRMLVSAKNNENGDVDDAMLEDLNSEALINLAIHHPEFLDGRKYSSYTDFVNKEKGNTPIADMYDPEMDRKDYSFEFGDVLLRKSNKEVEPKKQKDYAEMSMEDVMAATGMKSKGSFVQAEKMGIRKLTNLHNNSFMKKAEMESAKLTDLVTDFIVEYDDQLSSGDVDANQAAFDQFLKLLIENDWVGGYINQLLSGGKITMRGINKDGIFWIMTHTEDLQTRVEEIKNGRKPNQKSEADMFAARLAANTLTYDLIVEEYNSLIEVFEDAIDVSNYLKENTPEDEFVEEDFREVLWDEINRTISSQSFGLHTQRDRLAQAVEPVTKTSQTQEDALRNKLKARRKDAGMPRTNKAAGPTKKAKS